jgi:hypothetical protein
LAAWLWPQTVQLLFQTCNIIRLGFQQLPLLGQVFVLLLQQRNDLAHIHGLLWR